MALRELVELRQQVEALARELADFEWRRTAGLPRERELAAIVEGHAAAGSRDALAAVGEALASAQGAARVARLSALREFVVRARALALDPGAAQELADWPDRPSVRLPGDAGLHGALPPAAVERELPFEAARQRRAEMEAALADAAAQLSGASSAAWDAAR